MQYLLDLLNGQRSMLMHLYTTGEREFEITPANGKWSAHENLAHLVRYHEIFQDRLSQILNNEAPHFTRYVADVDPEHRIVSDKSTGELVKIYSEQRYMMISMMERLHPSAYQRIGSHPKFGYMTVHQWIEFFILHEAHHLFTIFQLIRSLSTEPSGADGHF